MSTLGQKLSQVEISSYGGACVVWYTRATPIMRVPWCARSTWPRSSYVSPPCSRDHRKAPISNPGQRLPPSSRGRSLLRPGSIAAHHENKIGNLSVLRKWPGGGKPRHYA